MTEPLKSEEEIFNHAAQLSAAERRAYLEGACGGDTALRVCVEALLQAHDEAGTLLDAAPGGAVRAALTTPPPNEAPGTLIGRYKLLQKIGEGGCGVVYMAEQVEPVRRRVALKVIKLGMDTREVIARFEAERQALALMDHPNIARVLDGGATSAGRPYFVMELVRGVPITTYCDEQSLSTPARLGLFMQVCHAVQHAHQKGIIHRDLKPSNILVTVSDGAPVPKVIDFGIAKATQGRLTDRTLFTAFEQFIGTPAYMSPEQAELTSLDVDTRSDIYSLGVLLYELLTGQTPFDAKSLLQAGLDEIRRVIREVEPPKPSARLSTLTDTDRATVAKLRGTAPAQLSTLLRGDLDWIVMRCLEKDRRRRYETANGLAMDLQRHLSNEPVAARPPSAAYRFQKSVRRNRLAFFSAAAVSAALLLGFGVSTWQYFKEKTARERAIAAEKQQSALRLQAETALERAIAAEREQSQLRQQAEESRNKEARQRALAEEARNSEARQRLQAESDRKKAETETRKSRQVAQFLQDMLHGVGPSVALGRDTRLLREILDKTVERLGRDLKDQPEVEAVLRSIIGNVYYELGEFEKAEVMQREALSLLRKLFGPEHPTVAASLNNLGQVLFRRGDLAGAETVQLEALAMQRKLLGNGHPDVAASLNNLANIRSNRGDLAGAESILREALSLLRKLFGPEHPAVATSLNILAQVLLRRGDFAEAEALQREALAMQRKLLGDEHPDVATSLSLLAQIISRRGDLAGAEILQREALALQRKLVGNEHPEVATTLNSLANTLETRGDFSGAEALQREALAMQRKLLGNEHPDVATTLYLLGQVVSRRNNAEAVALLREALAMQRKLLGNEHPDVAQSLSRLAGALLQSDPAGAEAAAREALALRRKLFGHEHPELAFSLNGLASTLMLSDPAGAEAAAREALAMQRKLLGSAHPDVAGSLGVLAVLLIRRGNLSEAEVQLVEAWKINEAHPSDAGRILADIFEYLYTLWSKTDSSKAALAAEWRQKLADFNNRSQP